MRFIRRALFVVLAIGALASPAAAALKGKMIKIASGSEKIDAYLAEPAGEPTGNLVVVHEWWGLNDWVKRTADRFAAQGFRVLAPDLYRGKVATKPELAHELMRGLPEERAAADVQAAAAYLRPSSSGPTLRNAVIGFCMGGRIALVASLENSPFEATVVCYGAPVLSPTRLSKMRGPLLGIYGELDQGIPPDQVKKFGSLARGAQQNARMIEYPGVGHAFLNDTNKDYDAVTANKAWTDIDAFLAHNLAKPSY